ncbi:MAG: OmpA family protein [Saprospiraceae bacterium]|nr:OmpA family protein [Candidatus Brachybacter algidus]
MFLIGLLEHLLSQYSNSLKYVVQILILNLKYKSTITSFPFWRKLALFSLITLLHFNPVNAQFTENLIDKLTVHFASGSHTVSDTDKVKIQEFINDLDVVIPYVFRIQSHTDSIGSLEFNQKLSERRSESIRVYLRKLGVPDILISTKGIGEIKPVMSNADDDGRKYNRRSNVFVFEIQKQRLFKSKVVLKGARQNRATVYIQSSGIMDSVFTDDQGNFAFIVPEKKDVTFGVFAPGYMFTTRKINTNADLPVDEITLNRIKKGEKVSLQNLYFVGDKAILLPESQPELINLLRFVRNNKNLKLEIGGHVNGPEINKGSPEWYYNLAFERTVTIKNYLVNSGMDRDNYECKSYSNTQMIYPEPTNESEAKLNRRVEIKVVE